MSLYLIVPFSILRAFYWNGEQINSDKEDEHDRESIFVIMKMVVMHHMLYKMVTRNNACSGKIGVTFDQRNFKVCFIIRRSFAFILCD
ncbi:hypothetical protein Hanom_Chr03g00210921 [Helianthus anomalus]